jgi:hypothetical protein
MVHPKHFLQQQVLDSERKLLSGTVQRHDQQRTDAVALIQSLWRRKSHCGEEKRDWILLPVLIIPGIASSGLIIEESGVHNERHAGQRVWMNAPFLAASRLSSGIVNAAELLEEKLNPLSQKTAHDDSFSSAEQAYEIRSAWLFHMSLSNNMVDERPGNRVRVYPGVCEFFGGNYFISSTTFFVGGLTCVPVMQIDLSIDDSYKVWNISVMMP